MIPAFTHRAPRSSFNLSAEHGIYAHFLKPGIEVPMLEPGINGIIYVGRTQGQAGFRGRDHFAIPFPSSTVRQSLAALLAEQLEITILPHRRSWTIDGRSDARLRSWMHDHLLLAIEPYADAPLHEQRAIWAYRPPLNLKDCPLTPAHERLSALRRSLTVACRTSTARSQASAGTAIRNNFDC